MREKVKGARSVLFAAVLLVAAPRLAHACSCIVAGPPCQEVFRAGAVFAGVVQGIEIVDRPGPIPQIPTMKQRIVHLRVSEAFRGDVGADVDVVTGMGGGDCGFDFQTGGSYLVYADSRGGTWSTGICSRTRPIGRADEDLSFLRNMSAAPSANGRLQGVATYIASPTSRDTPPDRRPFAGAQITFTSGDRTLSAVTGADGRYALDALPGQYRTTVSVAPGYYATPAWGGPAKLEDARGCAAADIFVRDDGHILGRVVDEKGRPVPNLAIEMGVRDERSRIQWSSPAARTDADGRYEFARRDAGEYVIGVNTTRPYSPKVNIGPPLFLPGVETLDQAQRVSLPVRARIDVPDFVLPASVGVIQLIGTVVGDDGRPVSDVHVYLEPDDASVRLIGDAVVTGKDGRFAFATMANVSYKVVAEFVPATQNTALIRAELTGVRPSADAQPLVLRLVKR